MERGEFFSLDDNKIIKFYPLTHYPKIMPQNHISQACDSNTIVLLSMKVVLLELIFTFIRVYVSMFVLAFIFLLIQFLVHMPPCDCSCTCLAHKTIDKNFALTGNVKSHNVLLVCVISPKNLSLEYALLTVYQDL